MDRTKPTRSKLKRLAVRLLASATSLVLSAPFSVAALAQDEESKSYDARLERYPGNVTLDSGGTALTWLLVIVLAALCIGVLLKNANRTHLD